MTNEIASFLALQRIDKQVLALRRDIQEMPRHVAAIEKQLASHQQRLEADRNTLVGNQRERKLLEGEVQSHQSKISKLRDQILTAKTNEQYRAFQSEIQFAEQKIRQAEDRVLTLMEEAETLSGNVKQAEASLAEERKKVEAETQAARANTAHDEQQVQRLLAERAEVAAVLGAKNLSTYERIRKKWSGAVVAEGTTGICSECRMAIRAQHFEEIKHANTLMFCESCGRVLIYNPAVEVVIG